MLTLQGALLMFAGAAAAAAAAEMAADPGTAVALRLIEVGIVGTICAYLLWERRAERGEHRAEREKAWSSYGQLKEAQQETNLILTRIEATLKKR